MTILQRTLYDPAVAVSKDCSTLLAMTALDTVNLRLPVAAPPSGIVVVQMECVIEGATTYPQILLGVLESGVVLGRKAPRVTVSGTALATTRAVAIAEFTIGGLSPGTHFLDAAYGVEFGVASTGIKYGGPNDTTSDNAYGGFSFMVLAA